MNIEVYVVRIKPLDNALKCKSFIAGITYGTSNTLREYAVRLICIKLQASKYKESYNAMYKIPIYKYDS